MKKIITLIIILLFIGCTYLFLGNPFNGGGVYAEDIGPVISFLVLLLVVLIVPPFSIRRFSRGLTRMEGIGKGIFIGGLIALAYDAFDLYIIKQFIIKGCSDWCGIENILLGFVSVGYIVFGLIIWGIGKYMNKRNLTNTIS
jgi:hypothetical protein